MEKNLSGYRIELLLRSGCGVLKYLGEVLTEWDVNIPGEHQGTRSSAPRAQNVRPTHSITFTSPSELGRVIDTPGENAIPKTSLKRSGALFCSPFPPILDIGASPFWTRNGTAATPHTCVSRNKFLWPAGLQMPARVTLPTAREACM